jgi:hypothetical protein
VCTDALALINIPEGKALKKALLRRVVRRKVLQISLIALQ